VVTPNGRRGYVRRRFLWNPVDYRVGFKKVGGKWRMDALTAGD
jgi:hypothetical protein